MENLLKKLDLTSLRLFVAVCQEKNIARAAGREFIASSAVSRRIAEIEPLVGLPVIQRQSRGVTVTPVGETVLRYAQTIIANIEQMSAELSRFSSGAKGSVRVVANLSSIVQFLPEDVSAFTRVFPEVSIELEEENSADVLRIVEEHGADFGICNPVLGVEAFEQLPYRVDQLALMVPRGHRLADAHTAAFADVLADSFVGLRSESALAQLLSQQATQAGRSLDVKIRVSSLDALCRMVHVGLPVRFRRRGHDQRHQPQFSGALGTGQRVARESVHGRGQCTGGKNNHVRTIEEHSQLECWPGFVLWPRKAASAICG